MFSLYFITININYYCMCVHVYVQVRGHLGGLSSLLLPWGSMDQQRIRLMEQTLPPPELSHWSFKSLLPECFLMATGKKGTEGLSKE